MGQDIRELMKNRPEAVTPMPKHHERRFIKKLDQLHKEKQEDSSEQRPSYFIIMKIAAIAIVMLSVSYFGYQYLSNPQTSGSNQDAIVVAKPDVESDLITVSNTPKLSLGDLSPDLKKIEDFYTTGINVQLASLQENPENKELIDGYLKRISDLDTEYNRLNNELTQTGPTEATINAMIDNLKLRLDMLFKLKNKLKELKNLENETISNIQV